MRFEAADSHRVRAGTRVTRDFGSFAQYIGLAYDYELDGKSRASMAHGVTLSDDGNRGGTGLVELGISLKPSQTLPLFFDVDVQGYTGKRDGVSGTLRARVEF